MNRKVYVPDGNIQYVNWMESEIVKSLEECEFVVFTGGEDVHPSMYNEPKGIHTYSNLTRDLTELEIFKQARELGKKCVGICRGSQFMSVMAGGRLIQHQQNPSYIHSMNTEDGVIIVNSTHHQAQYPYNLDENDYKIIGWTEGLSKYHLDGTNKEISDKAFKECEVVYYKNIDCLGIQPHPEMLFGVEEYESTINYFRKLLTKFLNNQL